MTDSMLPIIRQMLEADGDRARADILLRCPDAILLKHAETFRHACQKAGFAAGPMFVDGRVALMLAVRNSAGGLPGRLAMEAEQMRAELAAFAAGAPVFDPGKAIVDPGATWPLDAPAVPTPLDI